MNEEIKQQINSIDYRSLLHSDIGNGIYLTDMQKNILTRYKIEYLKCSNINELIYHIEDVLNERECEELEDILNDLVEIHYYRDTKK